MLLEPHTLRRERTVANLDWTPGWPTPHNIRAPNWNRQRGLVSWNLRGAGHRFVWPVCCRVDTDDENRSSAPRSMMCFRYLRALGSPVGGGA
jgi:hypothetical protein